MIKFVALSVENTICHFFVSRAASNLKLSIGSPVYGPRRSIPGVQSSDSFSNTLSNTCPLSPPSAGDMGS